MDNGGCSCCWNQGRPPLFNPAAYHTFMTPSRKPCERPSVEPGFMAARMRGYSFACVECGQCPKWKGQCRQRKCDRAWNGASQQLSCAGTAWPAPSVGRGTGADMAHGTGRCGHGTCHGQVWVWRMVWAGVGMRHGVGRCGHASWRGEVWAWRTAWAGVGMAHDTNGQLQQCVLMVWTGSNVGHAKV
eukprot:359426-Chlamydomonas_euryale.AAC.7